MIRKLFLVIVFLQFCSYGFTQQAGGAHASSATGNEILWDTYGVPHIYGKNLQGTYYAFGWAQMHNHANLLLGLYGQARGKAAEYWGERFFMQDKKVLLFNIPSLAATQYAAQKPVFKSYLDAFVKGVNDYAAAHPEAIDADKKIVLPIKAIDVLSHALRVLYLEFLAADDIGATAQAVQPGSNAMAIAPAKSRSKNAMLISNPHLPWADFFTFFEAHLNAPGFQSYGATLIGMPMLAIAFNEHLGWTHTVNTIDASDVYELTLKENGYLLDNKKLLFTEKKAAIKIKQQDGSYKTETGVFKYSKHGAVLGEKNGKAYAVRIAGMNNASVLYQWHLMNTAQDRAQFEQALQMMQLPMFNVVYADDKGNISYTFAGNVPVRQDGDWQFWHQAIDGTKSKLIWKKTHPYKDMPMLLNPPTGFVQNANDPPWTSTYPPEVSPFNYPAYMSPLYMDLRPQRAVNMIKDNASVSFDELVACKLNTGLEAADRLLPDLLDAIKTYPDSIALQAAAVLSSWDKTTDSSARGALLFMQWMNMYGAGLYAKDWDAAHPVETPAGLKDAKRAVEVLDCATVTLQRSFGKMDVPWGDVFRFRLNGYDYAANGGPDEYGIFRTIYYRPDGDKKFAAVGGDSYVAVTEFGLKPRAKVLLSYGNASQKGSKHIGDQLLLLSQKQLRDAWLDREEVLRHLENRETF